MVDVSLAVAVADHAVAFTVTVTNSGPDAVDLTFPDGKVVDVAVADGSGEVWRWSTGRMFTQAVEHRTLAPGESLTRTVEWSDPRPGTYTAEATLAARDVDATARAEFTV